MEQATKKTWKLEPEQELRIEVDHMQKITIKMTEGTAEIFGSEIAMEAEYLFTGRKFAIYSWRGCSLDIDGECSVSYVAGDTPMYTYLNAHLALQQMRNTAQVLATDGPRVMIVGPADVGKTSISKIFLNYCVKQGGKPVFVDLDSTQGTVTIPGALTATSITKPIDAEEDFGSTPLTTNLIPISFYYGYTSPLEKPKFYNSLLERLAELVERKLKNDPECIFTYNFLTVANHTGLVINTPCQLVEGASGFEILKNIANVFKVNVVFVIGHERLYNDLNRQFTKESGISVVKLVKSGGVVNRDQPFRKQTQSQKIREYFYGNPNTALGRSDLNPYSTTISFHEIAVHRVGEGILAPTSALPLGEDRKVDETRMVNVECGNILLHSILALLDTDIDISTYTSENPVAADDESQQLLSSNITGFVYVANVDETRKKLTILSPSPGKLPKKHLIMGALKWIEMH